MDIRYFKSTWGMSGTLDEQLTQIQTARFRGFEAAVPHDDPSFRKIASDHRLEFAAMAFPLTAEEVKSALDKAISADACLLNLHSGKDWWTFSQGVEYFEAVERIQESSPIPICHETHRGRLLFSPGITAAFIEEVPSLKIAADFSHWTCVCESMLDDQTDALQVSIDHTIHIHSRVGHEEGPQVSDPRAPEFTRNLEAFTGWWQRIVDSARRRGLTTLIIDPEFGPPSYMPTLPYTRQPVADLWTVCEWMRDHLEQKLT